MKSNDVYATKWVSESAFDIQFRKLVHKMFDSFVYFHPTISMKCAFSIKAFMILLLVLVSLSFFPSI